MRVEHDPELRRAVEAVAGLPASWTPVTEHVARGLWRLPRAADAVTHALTGDGPAGRDRGWVMVRARVAEEVASGRDWTREAACWLARGRADWRESVRVTADLAWRARADGHSALVFLTGAHVAGTDPGAPYGRALWHCFLTTLRYDFRCGDIEEFFSRPGEFLSGPEEFFSGGAGGDPADGAGTDPYVAAMRAFALLGRSRTAGLPLLEAVLARAADDRKVVHALLHGVWLGEALPGQPELMLRLLDSPAFAAGLDAEALFRRASALRRLRRFDEALEAVQSAIDGLDPRAVTVHADCVRERALILMERDLHRDAPPPRP
ncbi:hypothetical protein [Streptomyces sp. CRN 30]|uniref:hypothetical protein n=1 Tax=Streptomyces sp. CRN 30 TaxID=3075613 RepID=UPI002A7F6445|nr:hypothetical protein [Streptomyces sp. CRN 30]